jgi:uncharacterized protein (TIGR02646 family)
VIRVRRGAEPAKLPDERRKRLKIAAEHAKAGMLRREHIIGYEKVKSRLWRAQHHKCCYCERNNLETTNYDVEHFRPAMRAGRGAGFPDHGYWWLAWSWENLMFSCTNCNRVHKNDQFPLAAGSVPLKPREAPPGKELPLLIDPAAENPMDHIQFRPVRMKGMNRWMPVPRSGSEKGLATIETLKLARPDLLDLYRNHVDQCVVPVVKHLREEMAAGDRPRVQGLWRRRATQLVNVRSVFTALSYDALDQLVLPSERKTWGLALRRPR